MNGYLALTGHVNVPRFGTAVSSEARTIDAAKCALLEASERSFALFGRKAAAISEIWALAVSHAEAGWDGDDALPVSAQSALLAEAVIRVLPSDIPMPEFAPEPDGSISLDWIHARTRLVSISAGTSHRLAYAWLDGTDRGRAVARFDGRKIPPRVLSAIRDTVLTGHASIRGA
jgi:hypothetical protein